MNHSYKECRNPKWLRYNCRTLTDQHQGWNCPYKAGSSYSKFKWVKDSKKEIKFPKKKPQGNTNFTNLDEIPSTSTGESIYKFISDSGADEHFVNTLSCLNNIEKVSFVAYIPFFTGYAIIMGCKPTNFLFFKRR